MMKFKGKELEYYNALMKVRGEVTEQMRHCADTALSSDNIEKRGVTTHMADVGSDSIRHEMGLQLMSEEGDVLELIEEAIKRLIENNGFGICQDCGEPIPPARLEVRPYAIYCTKCKSVREKNGGNRLR